MNNNKAKKSKRARRNRRRVSANPSRLTTGHEGTMIHDRTMVKLRLSEYFADDPGSPAENYVFMGNALFNPLTPYGSVQPAGFQRWMAFYSKYKVLGSRIKIEATASSGQQIWIVIYPSVVATPLGTIVAASCQPFARRKMVGVNTGTSVCYVNNFISTAKVVGRNVMGDEGFAGDIASNPAFKWYWIVELFSSGIDAACQFMLTIEYDVIFYGRLALDETAPV